MNRNDLINRLVARKMSAKDRTRAFCICIHTPAKKLGFAAAKPSTAANPKT
jgi:hypothetical protein